jgi:hypothetical protein
MIIFSPDKIHPFKSGASALLIFRDNNLFKGYKEVINISVEKLWNYLVKSFVNEYLEKRKSNSS